MEPRDKNNTSFYFLFWFDPVGQIQKAEEICFFLYMLYFFAFYHHKAEAIFTHISCQPKEDIF